MRTQLADSKYFRVGVLERLQRFSEASEPVATNEGEH